MNVRTYVIVGGKPGVWFLSLDAENRFAVRMARATFHLPYMDAEMSIKQDANDTIDYVSKRTHRNEPPAEFDASYGIAGQFFEAEPGSLEH